VCYADFVPEHWTAERLPDLQGHIVIVTGSNAGIGFETAKALAGKGATVLMACRSRDKAESARAEILEAHPKAEVVVELLDLSDLCSVEACAEKIRAERDHVDLLVNNAGVMTPPEAKTKDGFELQFGTNHLGHFAFTGRLLARLEAADAPRVVTVSSLAHLNGDIDFGNFRLERPYRSVREYAQSKLANLSFTLELERRLRAAGHKTLSMGAHPGVTGTELARHFPGFLQGLNARLNMPAWKGALPSLYAAVEQLAGGSYVGPDGFREIWGWPAPARTSRKARSPELGRRLFDESEKLTGVDFGLAPVG